MMRSIQAVLVVAVFPLYVSAQETAGDSARLQSARTIVLAIPVGAPLRIETIGNSVIEGRLASRSDTGIVIAHRRDSSRVSINRIATVWRPANNVKRYAIGGLITGGIVGGLLLGVASAGFCDAANCDGAFTDGAVLGSAFGAGFGAVIGAGLGALTHHWQRVTPKY